MTHLVRITSFICANKYSLGATKFDKWHNQFFYGCCCCFRENNYYWLSSCRSKRMKWTKLINTTCYLSLSDFSKFRLSLIAPCSCTVSRKKNTQPSFAFWPFYDDFNRLLTTISKDHWVPRMLFALLTLIRQGFLKVVFLWGFNLIPETADIICSMLNSLFYLQQGYVKRSKN